MNLPETLWECMEVALADMHAVEKLPNHSIKMTTWVTRYNTGRCECCLAGATIVMGHSPKILGIDNRNWDKLSALNLVRVGLLGEAYAHIHVGDRTGNDFVDKWKAVKYVQKFLEPTFAGFETDRPAWESYMQEAIVRLKELNL